MKLTHSTAFVLVAVAATTTACSALSSKDKTATAWNCANDDVPMGESLRCVQSAATLDGPTINLDTAIATPTSVYTCTAGELGCPPVDATPTGSTEPCSGATDNPDTCPPSDSTGGAGGTSTSGGTSDGTTSTGTGTGGGAGAGGDTSGSGTTTTGNGNGGGAGSNGNGKKSGTSDGTTSNGNGSGGGNGASSGPPECSYVPDLPYCSSGGSSTGGSGGSSGSTSGGTSDGTSSSSNGNGNGNGGASSSSSGGASSSSSGGASSSGGTSDGTTSHGNGNGGNNASSSSGGASSSGASGNNGGGTSDGTNGGGKKQYTCQKDDKGNKSCESIPNCAPGTHPSACGACVTDGDSGDCVPPSEGGCWVTGGGFIEGPNVTTGAAADGHDNFGGNAKPMKDGHVQGHWNHVDHGTGNHSKGHPEYIVCRHVDEPGPGQPGGKKGFTMNQVYFGGPAEWAEGGGPASAGYWFDVVAKDHGEPGSQPSPKNGFMVDTYHFTIRKMDDPAKQVSGAIIYETKGGLVGGNIQLHPPNNGHPYTPMSLPSWVSYEP